MSVGLAPIGYIPTEQGQHSAHGQKASHTLHYRAYTMSQGEGGLRDFL